jgi:AraC-like DNA-binding protein
MPSSAVRTFTDPDDYATSIRATRAEMTVMGRGHFTANLTRIDLHRLWMQRFSDNLPRIAHSAAISGRATISFPTQLGPSLLWAGAEMKPTNITRHSEGANSFQHSSGSACWGAMSLPADGMAIVGAAMVGCDLTPPRDTLGVTPSPAAMAKLQRLHSAAGQLTEEAPEIIANPDAARGLEQALIEAMIGCLGKSEVGEGQRGAAATRADHAPVSQGDGGKSRPAVLSTGNLQDDRGVGSNITAMLPGAPGIGPKRYLLLRRMHLARRALRESSPTEATVTETATRYGFWHLGRFAVAYQSLFGEMPSATLHRRAA